MTTLINVITTKFVTAHIYGALSDGIASLSVVLLIILLIEKVLLGAYEGRPVEHKTQVFTIVIWPLLFIMTVTMFLRVAQVLHLW